MIGKRIINLQSVDSTNLSASELLAWENLEEGTVITAYEQYAGKGQRQSAWESNPGDNITISIVIYPTFLNPPELFLLNEIVSLAIADFLNALTGLDFKIKWPNDIMYKNRKISGILIENNLKGHSVISSIIGIGVNINQTGFKQYTPEAVSIKQLANKHFEIDECVSLLLDRIGHYYSQLKQGRYEKIHAQFKSRLFRISEWHYYLIKDEKILAFIEDVLVDGRLVLKTKNDHQLLFDIKEIKSLYN